jgi:Reverse transcriptase (RNA-dependent DNA polymerase)
LKLFKAGVSGPLFDWLRLLYARISYIMRDQTASTTAFKSIIGVLTGDTASPVLWNIYFADLTNWLHDDIHDVCLYTRLISHVEQADDVGLFSTTFFSLQKKVDCFLQWCDVNFMDISAPKSKWMIMGDGNTGGQSLKVRRGHRIG